MVSGIERRSGVALWRQIADDIRAAIGNGVYDAARKLPTEAALAAQFDVNRHTVRQALAALARDGIVRTVQGRGTELLPRTRVSYPISARTRFSAGLGGQVARATTRFLATESEPASEEVARALALAPQAPVLRMETIGAADGTALSRATHWFDAARFADLPAHCAQSGSITHALKACGVSDYRRFATEIGAAPASRADREDLGLEPGAVVLLTTSVNADQDGMPIQMSRSRFAADRVTLSVRNAPEVRGEAGDGDQ
ncbi:phosphonate metabolism transcriptional regulator PhnF [Stappia sp. ES.058]|uniref:phosphonate metabolism transcriptional regulator PhnF n=1 Tax=Stappia sp. ES.058 TaxID=1881061 RepID=UPI00087B87AE|nr:phosphonate metabolism transcriptional regulator PhnF [Stappia sp. ES.058]SDU31105.1 GntR family transcriptional regulator, phosphonate transport system regulatory protein [Stappia sp. ES.058]